MKSLIEQFFDNNFLITTSQWFIAPDGKSYKAVWGRVEIHSDKETLGIQTNDKSTNWYAVIGVGGKRVIVAGCQIQYACVSMQKPNTNEFEEKRTSDWAAKDYVSQRETMIYLAQD